jgi:hypothetical protein
MLWAKPEYRAMFFRAFPFPEPGLSIEDFSLLSKRCRHTFRTGVTLHVMTLLCMTLLFMTLRSKVSTMTLPTPGKEGLHYRGNPWTFPRFHQGRIPFTEYRVPHNQCVVSSPLVPFKVFKGTKVLT